MGVGCGAKSQGLDQRSSPPRADNSPVKTGVFGVAAFWPEDSIVLLFSPTDRASIHSGRERDTRREHVERDTSREIEGDPSRVESCRNGDVALLGSGIIVIE